MSKETKTGDFSPLFGELISCYSDYSWSAGETPAFQFFALVSSLEKFYNSQESVVESEVIMPTKKQSIQGCFTDETLFSRSITGKS
jgi:hypothetical protein